MNVEKGVIQTLKVVSDDVIVSQNLNMLLSQSNLEDIFMKLEAGSVFGKSLEVLEWICDSL